MSLVFAGEGKTNEGARAIIMGFEFKHIKRIPITPSTPPQVQGDFSDDFESSDFSQSPSQGMSLFGFIHKRREETLVRKLGGFLYGAFDISFDPDSFFVRDEVIPGFISRIEDFLFRHIKSI
jgi:hypothetical protein